MICSRKNMPKIKVRRMSCQIIGENVPKTLSRRENMPKMPSRRENMPKMPSRRENVPNILSKG